MLGVTGSDADFHKNIRDYLTSVKEISPVPVMLGFGIKESSHVKPLLDVIDGAIVGSNLIKVIRKTDCSIEAIKKYVSDFRNDLNS